MQAPKNGFFYVLDRLTGELLSADPIARVTWASGVDLQDGPSDRDAAGALHRSADDDLAGPRRRAQLAADVVQPGDRARLHPRQREQLRVRPRHGVHVPARLLESRHRPCFEHRRGPHDPDAPAGRVLGRHGRGGRRAELAARVGSRRASCALSRAAHRCRRRWHAHDGGQPRVPGPRHRQARGVIAPTLARRSGRRTSASASWPRRARTCSTASNTSPCSRAWAARARCMAATRPTTFKAVGRVYAFALDANAPVPPVRGIERPAPTPIESSATAGRRSRAAPSCSASAADVPRRRRAERRLDRGSALRGAGHVRRVREHRAARRVPELGMPRFDWLTDADVATLRGYLLSRREALLAESTEGRQ